MKISRRHVLRGLGGAVLGLPLLEGLRSETAHAQTDETPPFAIFFRQACGVAAAQNTQEIGSEPERFWPADFGALTPDSMMGRAVDELVDYRAKLLIVKNVNHESFGYNDGHANGALQTLTARGPVVNGQGGDSEANGESIDHRIGRELNPDGRDSLFLYGGPDGGWLGGSCISYRGPGQRRAAIRNPKTAYQTITGGSSDLSSQEAQLLARRDKSINDLVRSQMNDLLASPKLSTADRSRLELHFDSIRDLEVALSCAFDKDQETLLETGSGVFDSTDGDDVITTIELHMDIAALAIACGYTRSVAIQLGSGNDGSTRFRDPDTGSLMENYHYISHRRKSHDSSGAVIPGSDVLHHKIDRYFGQMFKHLLDRLEAYAMPSGKTLLDHGVAVWHNDNGNGPAHSPRSVPWILAGSANGFLKQGMHIEASSGAREPNHNKMLNTVGSAVGLRNTQGDFLDDFGDPKFPKGVLSELIA